MKSLIRFVFLSFLFLSCSKSTIESNFKLCPEQFFYYANDTKIDLSMTPNEYFIEIGGASIDESEAKSFLGGQYNLNIASVERIDINKFWIHLKTNTDCPESRNTLKVLNSDQIIISALPVFYSANYQKSDYMLLNNLIIAKRDTQKINEVEFLNEAQSLDMEYVSKTTYGVYSFKVKDFDSGFEIINKANLFYEKGNSVFAHPDFYVSINPNN